MSHTFITFFLATSVLPPEVHGNIYKYEMTVYTATFIFFVIMIFCHISSVNSGGDKKHSWHRKKHIGIPCVTFPLFNETNDLVFPAHEK